MIRPTPHRLNVAGAPPLPSSPSPARPHQPPTDPTNSKSTFAAALRDLAKNAGDPGEPGGPQRRVNTPVTSLAMSSAGSPASNSLLDVRKVSEVERPTRHISHSLCRDSGEPQPPTHRAPLQARPPPPLLQIISRPDSSPTGHTCHLLLGLRDLLQDLLQGSTRVFFQACLPCTGKRGETVSPDQDKMLSLQARDRPSLPGSDGKILSIASDHGSPFSPRPPSWPPSWPSPLRRPPPPPLSDGWLSS